MSPERTSGILLPILVLLAVHHGLALKCYVCSSLNNPSCSSNLKDIEIETCGSPTMSSTANAITADWSTSTQTSVSAASSTEAGGSPSSTESDVTTNTSDHSETSSSTITQSSSTTENSSTITENSSTITESSSTIKESPSTIKESPSTIKENPSTITESPTTTASTSTITANSSSSGTENSSTEDTGTTSASTTANANTESDSSSTAVSNSSTTTTQESDLNVALLNNAVRRDISSKINPRSNTNYVCYKIVYTKKHKSVTERGCYAGASSTSCAALKEHVNPESWNTCSTCKEDGCNSSSAIQLSATTLLLLLATSFVLVR